MTKLKHILGPGLLPRPVSLQSQRRASRHSRPRGSAPNSRPWARKKRPTRPARFGLDGGHQVGCRRGCARIQDRRPSSGSVRGRQAAVQDRRVEPGEVRGKPHGGPQGAAQRLQGQLLHECLSDAPVGGVPAAHLRCDQGECHVGEAVGRRQWRNGRDRRCSVPDSVIRRRSHLEPHPAFPRRDR